MSGGLHPPTARDRNRAAELVSAMGADMPLDPVEAVAWALAAARAEGFSQGSREFENAGRR